MKIDFTDLSKRGGGDGRNDCQWGWLDNVRDLFRGRTVLDVGTGLSRTKERLPESVVTTHEACLECPADIHGPLSQIASSMFDAVICLDVIEHVVDYGRLAFDMARITRRWLYLTTPGANVTLNTSPYHFHEFEPWEILNLIEATGMTFHKAWGQQWSGSAQYEGVTPINLLTEALEVSRTGLLTKEFLHPVALLFIH